MTDANDQDETKTRMSLRPATPGGLGRTVDAGSVRQSFSHGRSKVVQVEVRKKRPTGPMPGGTLHISPGHLQSGHPPASAPAVAPAAPAGAATPASASGAAPAPAAGTPPNPAVVRVPGSTLNVPRPGSAPGRAAAGAGRALTAAELASRQRAIEQMQRDQAKRDAERREQEKISILSAAEENRRREEDARKAAEEAARKAAEEAREKAAEEAARRAAEEEAQRLLAEQALLEERKREERKAARDARYAARKQRVMRKIR